MKNPEFRLVAWTLKFYLRVQTQATPTAKPAATAQTQPATNRRDSNGKP